MSASAETVVRNFTATWPRSDIDELIGFFSDDAGDRGETTMPGIAELALGAAPIAGGALLGAAAGSFKGPDIRAMIANDMDLLERIPDDQPELKARLKASIDERINDLIEATEKSRALREAAASYGGNWRDIVVFICAVLFTIIWWNVSHSRSNWLLMFIVMIVLSVVAAIYAGRGIARAVANFLHRKDHKASP